jgi:Peptidase family M28
MRAPPSIAALGAMVTILLPAALAAQAKDLPIKYSGPPTKAEISAGDLMTRLYKFADDSMMGRQVGTEYNNKGTAYIEGEVRRLGLKPGGENGTFFQQLPYLLRALDTASTITAGGQTFKAGVDFLAVGQGVPKQYVDAPVAFGGTTLDTVNVPPVEQVRGKVVVMRPFMVPPGFDQVKFFSSEGYKRYTASFSTALAVVTITNEFVPAAMENVFRPTRPIFVRPDSLPIAFTITPKMAEALLGAPIEGLARGAPGKSISSDIRFHDNPLAVGRNVIAILEGSDPKLRGEFVAIGAHNDHVGFNRRPVDHDSVKAFMQIVMPQGADNPRAAATPEQAAQVKAMTDSLHALHGGARVDSIYNGADDDGSGSVSVLEIAEAFANAKVKPKRSIVFVWHAGEEAGMLGSGLFTDHPLPPVPRDSIVAQLNMDMVGRGRAADATGQAKDGGLLHGGKGYLQLVGSRRLSTELGDLVEKVNQDERLGFTFDYSIDANGHPQNIYCRSDHWSYAKWGIPVVFMTTGGHADYHQVTDEPQYIDYDHMADVARLVYALAVRVGNLDHRIIVDKPKPDPKGACRQ